MTERGEESQICMPRTGAEPSTTRMLRALVTFIATGAFIGYAPLAPGTAGSVLGLLLVRFAIVSIWRYSPAGVLVLFGVVFIFACCVANCAERIFAERDSSSIVLDEILGMIATMFGNPASWTWLIAGFTLFRLFDIIKPWPASWFDHMQGGAGSLEGNLVVETRGLDDQGVALPPAARVPGPLADLL